MKAPTTDQAVEPVTGSTDPVIQRRPEGWPLLSGEALEGPLGELVAAIAPHSEADPVGLLVQELVAFGNAIGRGPYYGVEGDRHYTNLFAALVGETAKGRKGTSWGQVRRVMRDLDPDWASNNIVSGLSSGEGLIHPVRDATKKLVTVKQGGEISQEEVIDDPGITDKRLQVFQAELGSTLRVMGRDGNILSPIIREAWDTGALQTMTRNNPMRATGAHVSLIGHITRPELLRQLDSTEAGSGFANRFLWVCVARSQELPFGGRPADEDLLPIIRRLRVAISDARRMGEVKFDPEARECWIATYPELSREVPGLLGAVISRAEAQTVRLALVYALAGGSRTIGLDHLLAALAVWQYCFESAAYIFGRLTGDPVADRIASRLADAERGLTRTEIYNLLGRHTSRAATERALDLLEQAGQAQRSRSDTGGRPVEVWYLTEENVERMPWR